MPTLLLALGGRELLQLQAGFPTLVADVHRQRIEGNREPLFATLDPGMQRQVVEGFGFAIGIGTAQFGRIEARHRALHGAIAPVEPELATGF